MTKTFDLLILGSGSTAFAAAIRAAELGKRAVMTESRTLGGTCVNRGCLPSKNLIAAAEIVYSSRHPRYPGLHPTDMKVNFAKLVRQKDEVIEGYRGKKYSSIVDDSNLIDVVRGTARLEDAHHLRVDGTVLEGDQVLIALGSHPVIPDIPGLESVPYVTSDLLASGEEMKMTELPQSMLVLGGGYIALELGQMFSRFGTKVTIVERGPEILRDYEPEIGSTLHGILEGEGIQVKTNTHVTRFTPDAAGLIAVLDVGGRQEQLRAERLLVATGRAANTKDVGLESAGVAVTPEGWVKVDHQLRTSVPSVWAAGDVIGSQHDSQMATPVGAHDGALVAHNALSKEPTRNVDHRVVPRTVFTDPQIGVVGLTEAEAQARGVDCQCRIVEMKHVPRAGAVRDTRGVIRMVAERGTDRVVGVSMLGLNAGEVIHEAAMAMRFRATIQDFIDMVHVYPTMAESLKIAALAFRKDITKLSCCAE